MIWKGSGKDSVLQACRRRSSGWAMRRHNDRELFMRNGRETSLRPIRRLTALAVAGALAFTMPAFAETAPLDTQSAAPAANALERLPSFVALVGKGNPERKSGGEGKR